MSLGRQHSVDVADLSPAVRAAQGGDEAAFRVLFREMQPRLLRYLQVLVGADAEDVASEVWLQIARDLSRFQGQTDGFRGWVTTIARNRALDHLRRQRRRPRAAESVEALADRPAGVDTERTALDGIDTDRALALIARLPRDQAEAVLLRVVIGLDAAEAARVLGKRAGAVRTAAYRGLRRLAKELEREEQERAWRTGHAGGGAPTQGARDRRASTLGDMI
jgi:RNA polymerase sigma-70 factor (ECF subfamily)